MPSHHGKQNRNDSNALQAFLRMPNKCFTFEKKSGIIVVEIFCILIRGVQITMEYTKLGNMDYSFKGMRWLHEFWKSRHNARLDAG